MPPVISLVAERIILYLLVQVNKQHKEWLYDETARTNLHTIYIVGNTRNKLVMQLLIGNLKRQSNYFRST